MKKHENPTPAIEINGLSVRYGEFLAVDSVDLRVPAGTVFGFVGPNGAGKSTTIRALLDLQRPSSGTIRILGEEVRQGSEALRERIGYLPGDLALFPTLRVDETLNFFARLQRREPVRREEVLSTLGFPDHARRRKIRACSTGMRQMVGIAIAMQHDPELLVLDEATTGLDPIVRENLLDLVRARGAEGKTVLFSGHVLDEVEACATQIGLIHEGRLRLVESVTELRRTRPRRVIIHRPDGSVEKRLHRGSPNTLLEELSKEDILDIELRPAGLRELFKDLGSSPEEVA